MKWSMFFFVILTVTLGTRTTHAGNVRFNLSGTMDNGDSFSGFFSFDENRPENNTSPSIGDYVFIDLSQADLVLDIGGDSVFLAADHADGRAADFLARALVVDDIDAKGDYFRLNYFTVHVSPTPNIPDLAEFNIDLLLIDEIGNFLNGDSLPTGPIDLDSLFISPSIEGWGDHFNVSSGATLRFTTQRTPNSGGNITEIRNGTITSLSLVTEPNPIPKPTSLTLLGIGVVSLFGYGWRRKRTMAA